MYVNDTTGVAVVCPPRTGSRSFEVLARAAGWRQVGGRHHVDAGECERASVVYCVVRNHWDVIASWWLRNEAVDRNGWSISEWLAQRDASLFQFFELAGFGQRSMYGRWLPHATTVVQFEDLAPLLRTLFGDAVEVPYVGGEGRHGRNYTKYYSHEDRVAVLDLFRDEIVALGLTFYKPV